MGGPALRAETARGETYDAPSSALLLRLLGELGPGNQYLIVDRIAGADGVAGVDDANEGHYMQVYREVDGRFAIEYREGAAERHFEAVAGDLRTAHAVLTGWAAGAPDWREAFDWRRWPGPDASGGE